MAQRESPAPHGYFFALPRLWAYLNARDARRYEQNVIEAYFVGVAVFLISYATILSRFRASALTMLVLFFATWLSWLVVFSMNSIITRGLRTLGLFHELSNSRAQNVLIGIEITACAMALVTQPRWWLLGCAALLIIAANCIAALALRLVKQGDA